VLWVKISYFSVFTDINIVNGGRVVLSEGLGVVRELVLASYLLEKYGKLRGTFRA